LNERKRLRKIDSQAVQVATAPGAYQLSAVHPTLQAIGQPAP